MVTTFGVRLVIGLKFDWFLINRYGRRVGYFAAALFESIFALACAFVPDDESWGIWRIIAMVVLRYILGVGIGGGAAALSLFAEFLPTKVVLFCCDVDY